ncbi:MAG: archease [Nitrospiraceae bacterium]
MSSAFRYLDDVALADIAFEATGDSPSDLFTAASHALIETLADPATVSSEWQRTIDRQESDLATLLFDWLSDIVYLKDAEGVVFHEVLLRLDQDSDGRTWRLHTTLLGATVDQATQELRADVKGVTKHLYALTEHGGEWKARVVLDV